MLIETRIVIVITHLWFQLGILAVMKEESRLLGGKVADGTD
jgi:hypothetical protein